MKPRTFTNEQLIEAVKTSTSTAQVLLKLNIRGGSSHDTIRKYVRELGLDTSHFTGSSWNRGKKFGPKRPIEDYLSNRQTIQSHRLRLRLIEEGIFKAECSSCHLTEWLGKSMPLELDHINGNHLDNSLSNLRILCPNCHVFTPTYKAKNRK